MANEIIVALIGLAGSALGSVIGVLASARLTQYRIEQLERKVDQHNSLIDRTYRLEAQDELREEQLRTVNHRLKELEGVRG